MNSEALELINFLKLVASFSGIIIKRGGGVNHHIDKLFLLQMNLMSTRD